MLELAAETWREPGPEVLRIAGLVGNTAQATREASMARELGYDAGLLSLGAWRDAGEDALIAHCRAVSEVIPLVGFYLQPAAGGRLLSYAFWRRLCEIDGLVAIKMAPFNRYQTLDVVRAVAGSGRAAEIALYTGNDDHIVDDLLTPFVLEGTQVAIVGGLLGQWAVWTERAVALLRACQAARTAGTIPASYLTAGVQLTDANAALFDAANGYAGCITGIHEILMRQGLLAGLWCLEGQETLSPGQAEEIDRVCAAYPELQDDAFVREHLDEWLK